MENEIINLIGSVPSYFITCLCLKKLGFGAFASLEMAPMVPKIGSMKIRRKKHPSCKNPSPQPLKDLGSTYQL